MSPDETAESTIADGLSKFAGELKSSGTFYKTGDMNSEVYGVHGGMEDWAYAGSWKTDMMSQCNPDTYGGYSLDKTTYDAATLRTFNILIETSFSKNPGSIDLGTDEGLLKAPFKYDGDSVNGFVAKHVRTALMAIDIVEPYVEITQYKKRLFSPELTPLVPLQARWSKSKKKKSGKTTQKPKLRWSVGGSFTVDETFLVYGKWSDFSVYFNGIQQLTDNQLETVLNDTSGKFYTTWKKSGETRWSNANSADEPIFKAKVKLSRFSPGDQIAVFAVAKVDQNWSEQPLNKWPAMGLQSHMANSRTDPSYHLTKTDRTVQGRLHWISVPVTINVK